MNDIHKNTEKIIDALLAYHEQLIRAKELNPNLVSQEWKNKVIEAAAADLNAIKNRLIRLIDMNFQIRNGTYC